jgi:hypothetical protein
VWSSRVCTWRAELGWTDYREGQYPDGTIEDWRANFPRVPVVGNWFLIIDQPDYLVMAVVDMADPYIRLSFNRKKKEGET